jgi:enoyl-CoA hydratase/carnithine racemase
MATFETLLYEEADGVAWITLNRPEHLNSFDLTMCQELNQVWKDLRFNDDVRVAVLTASGDRAFCTGIDRTVEVPQPSSPFVIDDPGLLLGPKTADLWKPVIAAVNGMACGGAFYMLGEAEFIIAAEHATFFDPHVTYGMCASFEPMHMLQRMPLGEIMRLSLMGNHERMSAERAYQVGLVAEVVPKEKLWEAADWAARAIASHPTVAVQGTVRSVWAARELGRSQALALAPALVSLGNQPEALAEGQEVFASGKRVEWRLR